MNSKWFGVAAVLAVLTGAPALAQLTTIFPAKGQSAQQQKKDESECNTRATQQSGYDPAKPSNQMSAPAPSGIAKSEGPRTGAVVGGTSARARNQHQQLQQQDELQARAQGKGPDGYNKARMACLTERGYKTKTD